LPPKKKNAQKELNSTIRIIAGQWRGRKLTVTNAEGLRPTGDRVRETLFNWLMPHTAGSRCLDLYAGTGALGLEALSRGASFVQFAEYNSAAAQQLNRNLQTLQCSDAQVYTGDAQKLLESGGEPYDIIFIDPPFSQNLWLHSLELLVQKGFLHRDTLVYIEHPKSQTLAFAPQWQCHREKTAGDVCYALHQFLC